MPDFHWALSHGRSNLSVYKSSLVKRILSSVELQSLITTEHTKAWARARCDEMLGEHLTFMNRFCAWLVHKFFKKIFDKIVIDQQ
jgi:hypothetical protein